MGFKLSMDGSVLLNYESEEGESEIAIPDGVSVIQEKAFYYCKNLTSIVIPDGVREIHDSAFCGCQSVRSFIIPDSVKLIDASAFSNCYSLKEIIIRGKIKELKRDTFSHDFELKKIILPEGLKRIGDHAFFNTAIRTIEIPETVTWVSAGAFDHCSHLRTVRLSGECKEIYDGAFAGVTGEDTMRLPKHKPYTKISETYRDSEKSEIYEGNGIWVWLRYRMDKVQHLIVPESITSIPRYAFNGKNITDITILGKIDKTGSNIFRACGKLEYVIAPNTSINVFDEQYRDILFRGYIKSYRRGYQYSDKIEKTYLKYFEKNMERLIVSEKEDKAFQAFLEEHGYSIKSGMRTNEGAWVYHETEQGIVITGYKGLDECVTVPSVIDQKKVVSIKYDAYSGYNKMMGNNSFWGNHAQNICRVIFEEGIREVDASIFRNLTALEYVGIPASMERLEVGSLCRLDRYQASLKDYLLSRNGTKLHLVQRDLVDVVIPDGVEQICDEAFSCSNAQSVVLPDSLKKLGRLAFGRSKLQKVSLPEGLDEIGDHLFLACHKLKEVTWPKDQKRIPLCTFSNCTSLESFEFPEGIKDIDSYAFSECNSLKIICIPKTVTRIGHEAFSGCIRLKNVIIPESVREIDGRAFSECKKLEYVRILGCDIRISGDAFAANDKLQRIEAVNIPITELPEELHFLAASGLYYCKYKRKKLDPVITKSYDDFIMTNKYKIRRRAKEFPILKRALEELLQHSEISTG